MQRRQFLLGATGVAAMGMMSGTGISVYAQVAKNPPWLVDLYRKLSRLKSTVTVMNSGAHPDDEQSALLTYLRMDLGIRTIVASSTRGAGGQNILGPERTGALAVLRTREMEESARMLDAEMCWMGFGPDDSVYDFGFSKDADATFIRWGGEDPVLERQVRAYRQYKPDVVFPTFLDVPGQHGHHRAMTRISEKAVALAADPNAYPEHIEAGLAPWQVAKYYLPAWSGAGSAYDDEIPPPQATLDIVAENDDPATGEAYGRIAQRSRSYHASQSMRMGEGVLMAPPQTRWQLHLKLPQTAQEHSITDNLPATLTQLADFPGLTSEVKAALVDADRHIGEAIEAFPRRQVIVSALIEAAKLLDKVEAGASDNFKTQHGHRITRKQVEIESAIFTALNLFERAFVDPINLAPGGQGNLYVELDVRADDYGVEVIPNLPAGVSAATPTRDGRWVFPLDVAADAPPSDLYSPSWTPLGGNGAFSVRLRAEVEGRSISASYDLEDPASVRPAHSLSLTPEALLVPLQRAGERVAFEVETMGDVGTVSFEDNQYWSITREEGSWLVAPKGDVRPGRSEIGVLNDGTTAYQMMPIAYPHIGRTNFIAPAALRVLALDLNLPQGARIGYVGGGSDRVGIWLQHMGLDVTNLDSRTLGEDFSQYTTIVVGVLGFGLRKDLFAIRERLHRFVEDGGHLVTLYHRPRDGWEPDATPVRHIEIGLPSLRWRVTNPAAEVTVLVPDHPLLQGPNVIGPDDWAGWDKERGLYFAAKWDEAYQPLLSMHDANEAPLEGSLLSGRIGRGRHTHTSLVLHHQLDRLVPGAFRLMANLVQPA